MKILITLMMYCFALQMVIAQEEELIPPEVYSNGNDTSSFIAYRKVEVMPQFPGGVEQLFKFISDNIQYPPKLKDTYIEGKVVVQFVVKEDGTLGNFEVLRELHPLLSEEALRVIKLMPKWIPGLSIGKPVPVWIRFPVAFKLK